MARSRARRLPRRPGATSGLEERVATLEFQVNTLLRSGLEGEPLPRTIQTVMGESGSPMTDEENEAVDVLTREHPSDDELDADVAEEAESE